MEGGEGPRPEEVEVTKKGPERISRRSFIKGVAGLAGLAVGSALTPPALKTGKGERPEKNDEGKKQTSTPAETTPKSVPLQENKEISIDVFNKVLSIDPFLESENGEVFSDERYSAEEELVEKAQILEDIDKSLSVVIDRGLRRKLLDKRHEKRKSGSSELTNLTEEQIAWCEKENINPETLGICIDVYKKASEKVEGLLPVLRKGFEMPASAQDILMNAGGMAKLMTWETNGFEYIGGGSAANQINPEIFPTDKEHLFTICEKISQNTGLLYNPLHIAGSLRGDTSENSSGGAIGPQFMPSNAHRMYDMLSEAGTRTNIFDVEDGVLMSYFFIALQEKVQIGNGEFGTRYGYLKGNSQNCIYAIEKWNPLREEVDDVWGAANSYYDAFLQHR